MTQTPFERWMDANAGVSEPEAVAKAAWDAAKAESEKIAREAAKRYACSKMRAICLGIADRIARDV